MKLPLLLLTTAAAAVQCVNLTYPAHIGIDVVFPLNDTYKDAKQMPIIFALHNADAAFFYGWRIGWEIRERFPKPNYTGLKYVGYSTHDPGFEAPVNAVNNTWYAASNIRGSDGLDPGEYTLKWDYTMRTCVTYVGRVVIDPLDEVAEGSVNFTIADDGSVRDLTKDCPIYQTFVNLAYPAADRCISVGGGIYTPPDPCKSRMTTDMADCVMANLTKSNDTDACSRLIRDKSTEEKDDNGGNDTSSDGGNSNSGGDEDKDNGGLKLRLSEAAVWAVLALTLGILI